MPDLTVGFASTKIIAAGGIEHHDWEMHGGKLKVGKDANFDVCFTLFSKHNEYSTGNKVIYLRMTYKGELLNCINFIIKRSLETIEFLLYFYIFWLRKVPVW